MTYPLDSTILSHYLITAAIIFCIGLIGFISRRNMIIMFLCTEMMFQGVMLSLVAFSKYHLNYTGQTFVVFVLTVAAAEAALALGLVVLLYRKRQTLDAMAWADMRG